MAKQKLSYGFQIWFATALLDFLGQCLKILMSDSVVMTGSRESNRLADSDSALFVEGWDLR